MRASIIGLVLAVTAGAAAAQAPAKTPAKAAAPVSTTQAMGSSLLAQDLDYVMQIWPGDYDNREQLQYDSDVGKKTMDTGGHLRVHSIVRRVDLPQIGPHVLYIEEYKNNDPATIFRARLYELVTDEGEKAIRVKMHFFKTRDRWLGSYSDPAKLKDITTADTSLLDGCDVLLRRDSDAFQGGMKTKTCAFGPEGKKRYSDYQLRIATDGVWFRDRMIDFATDVTVEQVAEFSWHEMQRARMFACMVDFPKVPGKPMMYTGHYITLHDQGGTFAFKHPDGRPMVLTLRNTWSYGMQRKTLVMVIQDKDEAGATLAYGWTEPGADRLGVNPSWIRIQCDIDTPRNRELQHNLRPASP